MTIDPSKAASRPLGVAEIVSGCAVDAATVYAKVVVLTGERATLQTDNGRWCFLDALALLTRVVGNLVVVLPEGLGALETEARGFCDKAWSRGSLHVVPGTPAGLPNGASAILNVGALARTDMPWTVVNSNGWVARVSSGSQSLPADTYQANPLGALMAASLGVTEVFKRVFGILPEVAPLLDKVEFSLFEQTTSPPWIGPPIPGQMQLPDTLIVGAGAIGNGIALALSRLPLRGRLHVIDKQDYADENYGTCILLDAADWVGQPKAERLAAWLAVRSSLVVSGEKSLIESAKSSLSTSGFAVDLILNGLDDIDARQSAQDLWPRTIVDGGINELGAAVVQYRLAEHDHGCLKCWFEAASVNEKALQSRLTGLDVESLVDIGRQLTDEDIGQADEQKREWLNERKSQGKTLCSIIGEAVLSEKLGVNVNDGFRPSAPFVATAAAAMVVAEAVKALAFPEIKMVSQFQIANLFIGPEETAIKLSRSPSPTCQCVVHRELIEKLAEQRRPAFVI